MRLARILPFVLGPAPLLGQCDPLKILASDGGASQAYGYALDVGPDFSLVGAYGDSQAALLAGAAYLLDHSGGELGKLTASDAQAFDLYGFAVDVAGTLAIVGAPNADPLGSNSGAAYLSLLPAGPELYKLVPSNGDAGDLFGYAVAVGADVALVGAWADEAAGTEAGTAYAFAVSTGGELFELTPGDALPARRFGRAVAVAGDLLLVGAPSDGSLAGALYVFDAATGVELVKLEPADGAVGDGFGRALDVHGDTALVGANGAAYLFDLATLLEAGKLEPPGPSEDFGASVALAARVALVGAPLDDEQATDAGAVHVFDRLTQMPLAKLLAADGLADDHFGHVVALDGHDALAGTNLADDLGAGSGAAYRFRAGDCNGNGVLDCEDLAAGTSEDLNGDGVPDECSWLLSPVNGHWYRATAALSWVDAELAAAAWGGHLATVRSAAENDWLAASFAGEGPLWLGYTDQALEGTFAWISGEPVTYERWAAGQPDDFLGADWALLDPFTGEWSDEPYLPEQVGVAEIVSDDCDQNGIPDLFEIAGDPARDWNGDGVLDECVPSNYCQANANSSGQPGLIGASGSPLVADNDFTLLGARLPTHEFGYFLMSETQAFVPNFGGSSGNLCLGGKIVRLAKPPSGQVLNTGPDGAVAFTVDLTVLPKGTVVLPGDTWNFQMWFRDFDLGPTSNTTDGIEVLFR